MIRERSVPQWFRVLSTAFGIGVGILLSLPVYADLRDDGTIFPWPDERSPEPEGSFDHVRVSFRNLLASILIAAVNLVAIVSAPLFAYAGGAALHALAPAIWESDCGAPIADFFLRLLPGTGRGVTPRLPGHLQMTNHNRNGLGKEKLRAKAQQLLRMIGDPNLPAFPDRPLAWRGWIRAAVDRARLRSQQRTASEQIAFAKLLNDMLVEITRYEDLCHDRERRPRERRLRDLEDENRVLRAEAENEQLRRQVSRRSGDRDDRIARVKARITQKLQHVSSLDELERELEARFPNLPPEVRKRIIEDERLRILGDDDR